MQITNMSVSLTEDMKQNGEVKEKYQPHETQRLCLVRPDWRAQRLCNGLAEKFFQEEIYQE